MEAELSTILIEPVAKLNAKASHTKDKKGIISRVKDRLATPGIGGSKFVEDFSVKSK